MIEGEFVPLAPRRLAVGGQASLAPLDVGGQASLAPLDVGGQASLAPLDVGGQASLAPFVGDRRRTPIQTPISTEPDEIRIRAAAIGLAAAACARALGYALDRNPRLLARFVDDALRAAGSPRTAIVRISPAATIAGAESRAYDLVADPALSAGDVFVDCDAGTLGATIGDRAERLVRAVAS